MKATLPLEPPRCLFFLTVVLHAAAVLVVLYTQLPAVPQILLLIAILLSGCVALLRINGRLGGMAVDGLEYAEGRLTCYARECIVVEGEISTSSVVTPLVMLLSLKDGSNKRTYRLLLCRSQFSGDGYRQLSVRLRLS